MNRSILACAALLAIAGVARADVIAKWRTPSGSLHFGDRPPPGSVRLGELDLERTSFTAANPVAAAAASGSSDPLDRAAAHGREIIGRRAAERAEERRLAAAAAETAEPDVAAGGLSVWSADPFLVSRYGFSDPFYASPFGGRPAYRRGLGPRFGSPERDRRRGDLRSGDFGHRHGRRGHAHGGRDTFRGGSFAWTDPPVGRTGGSSSWGRSKGGSWSSGRADGGRGRAGRDRGR